MRFLQLVLPGARPAAPRTGPPDPNHVVTVNKAIAAAIASGELLATGWVGKRATAAARVTLADGALTVEDPPSEAPGTWMAAGGFSLTEFATKEAAIASAADKLRVMGGGVVELIQVGEMHPASPSTARPARPAERPAGVVPYLNIAGAADAAAFYQRAFRAREVARMTGDDGRLMHCQLEINGGALMLADPAPEPGGPAVQRASSDRMQIVVDDGQAWWDRAIAAGCTPTLPFGPAPWGDLYGQLVDPYGVSWAIAAAPPAAG